jgi:hypothetical protein
MTLFFSSVVVTVSAVVLPVPPSCHGVLNLLLLLCLCHAMIALLTIIL